MLSMLEMMEIMLLLKQQQNKVFLKWGFSPFFFFSFGLKLEKTKVL